MQGDVKPQESELADDVAGMDDGAESATGEADEDGRSMEEHTDEEPDADSQAEAEH
jgi:hypothetical protein